MNLLIFFALPLATVLLAIVFEKILKCPILVAITFFSIYLIILFSLFATGVITDLALGLIAVIIYTIIAFIIAWIIKVLQNIRNKLFNENTSSRTRNASCQSSSENDNQVSNNNDLLRISCRCNNGNSQNLLTINSNCLDQQNNNSTCGCNNSNKDAFNNSGIALTGNVIPNQSNCGRTGWIRGCYRRY